MKDIDLNCQDLLVILLAFVSLGTIAGLLLPAHYKYASTRPTKGKLVSPRQKDSFPKPEDRPLSMNLPI
jgi:hypothetical protein